MKRGHDINFQGITGRLDYFTIELYRSGKKVASRPFREGKTCRLIEKEDEVMQGT